MQKTILNFGHVSVAIPNLVCLDLAMTSAPFRIEPNSGDDQSGVSRQLTAAEVADVLRVGPWTVVQLCQSGELPASKPGKSWLIDPADLRAYLNAHSNQRAEEAS